MDKKTRQIIVSLTFTYVSSEKPISYILISYVLESLGEKDYH